MEWKTLQHLHLQLGTRSAQQPHCATFHHSQPLLAVAAGRDVVELDVLTGCKLSSIDMGAPVLRMSYSPAGGHVIVAVLEDCSIKAWDLQTEVVSVLYSPPDRRVISANTEVHMALTPLRPWLFFGVHRRMSVTVVGTMEGVKQAAKIKADVKKPIVQLACHPRNPVLYVAYAEGLIKGYNIHSFSVVVTLLDGSMRLLGAGSFAFHSSLESMFVGDRGGMLLAWDVSVPARPTLIGTTQAPQGNPVASLAWHGTCNLLVTLTKDGTVLVWRPRVVSDPTRSQLRANFFEGTGVEPLDLSKLLSGKGSVYPLPRVVDVVVHPRLNFVTVLLTNVSAGAEESKKRAGPVSREARRQLFAVLQSARGSPASVIKEKLVVLGSVTNVLLDQQQLVQQGRESKLTPSDFARQAFLYGDMVGQGTSGPVLTLPLLTIIDSMHLLRDIPVYHPFDHELRFFNSEAGIFQYPARAFFMDGCNLMGYNLSSGEYNIFKKLSPVSSEGIERAPRHMVYSAKQHLFLICCECRGASNEVIIYRDPFASQLAGERLATIAGRDAAFIGPKERQYAVLDDNGEELIVQVLEEDLSTLTDSSQPVGTDGVNGLSGTRPSFGIDGARSLDSRDGARLVVGTESNGVMRSAGEGNNPLDPQDFTEQGPRSLSQPGVIIPGIKADAATQGTPATLFFETPVQGIFSTPLESTLLYSVTGSHIGFATILTDSYVADRHMLSTACEKGRSVELKPSESVLQLRWQDTPTGLVAGVVTTHRVMIMSSNLEVICSNFTSSDKAFPPFKSLLWVGPALLFSTATSVCVLGWDGVARSLVSIDTPNFALVGALNDRLLLVSANEPSPRQKQGVEIKTRLVGLLEALLIGWTTFQQAWDPKLDLSEILYQLTSRFDSTRITPHSLDVLAAGPPVCADLAVELAQAGPQFAQELRCKYAIQARRFAMAISILKDEYVRSRDYPRCPPSTLLFHRFRDLGQACIRYGQFDKAKETFEVVSDFESMFSLFLCHSNPSAMRRLAQKLEEVGTDVELKRLVDKVLLVWSSGWGQGGVFANISADSMLPKGPEWAGGNWEIKTHPPLKSMPDWALSNEVTAYMKTANGAIPTVIPDHIGVHLGTVRGRGTVVEVRENMLVKRLGQSSQDDNGIDTLGGSGRSGSSVSRNSDDGSQSGIKLKSHLSADEAEGDEQSRAAEAFKKGMFGLDNSSSDEEEGVKEKRRLSIRIREKSATGATVDINKVKEATRTFKLNDTLGKRPRRSEVPPPQDLFPGLSSPLPEYAQVAPLAAPPAAPARGPMPMGVGVGAGPIPEDFFENTIQPSGPSPLPGGLSHQLPTQPFGYVQGFSGMTAMPQQSPYSVPSAVALDSSIFGAGEPFQAAAQAPHNVSVGGVPPQPAQGLPSVDFGLPGGGVPPNPVDLGSFEARVGVPSSTDTGLLDSLGSSVSVGSQAGKPPISARAASPPRRYKPGQVPRGAPAPQCFKAGLAHIEQNQLGDAMSCFDEAFLALAKDQSLGVNVKAQARICAQYKIAVLLLQEIARLQRVEQGNAGAKEEMARLARHLSSLPLQAKHRISCLRTAIKRNMDVQNFAFAKKLLDLLLAKAPANKQDELKTLIQICVQRGLTDRTIDETEDPSQFCAATLARLPTIGHDSCDVCGSKFSALNLAGCSVCGMGTVERSDAASGAVASPFV